jgi:hypothetical protein
MPVPRKELIDGSAVYQKFIQKLQPIATVRPQSNPPRSVSVPFFKGGSLVPGLQPLLGKEGPGEIFGAAGKEVANDGFGENIRSA